MKMGDKYILLAVFSIGIVVGFLSFVSAVPFVGTSSPLVNQSNITGATAYLNASVFLIDQVSLIGNMTFYYQHWSYVGNATWTKITDMINTTANQSTFNITWDTTGVADGEYILNVTAWNANSTDVNATNVTANITIDNTAPTVAVYGGAALTAYANGTSIKTNATLTGALFPNNLTLNISVTDATVGLLNSSNQFCFINVGGGLNHSVPLTANRWCNSSDINITGLSDGNNTINIYVNDTLDVLRLNSTLVVQVDATDPTSTASCSPTTVQTGDSFPCACSGTDATSGVASSTGTSTSPEGISAPSSTGSFTYTCSVTDNGGLVATSTKNYDVTQTTGSPNSGGGSTTTASFWTAGTHAVSDASFEAGATVSLQKKRRAKVTVGGESHYVGIIELTSTQATINISSDPVQVVLGVGESTKVDVLSDGFFDIYVILNDITNNKANVTMTEIHEEVPEDSTPAVTIDDQGNVTNVGDEEPEDDSGGIPWWVWIIVVVVIIAVGVGYKVKTRNYNP